MLAYGHVGVGSKLEFRPFWVKKRVKFGYFGWRISLVGCATSHLKADQSGPSASAKWDVRLAKWDVPHPNSHRAGFHTGSGLALCLTGCGTSHLMRIPNPTRGGGPSIWQTRSKLLACRGFATVEIKKNQGARSFAPRCAVLRPGLDSRAPRGAEKDRVFGILAASCSLAVASQRLK